MENCLELKQNQQSLGTSVNTIPQQASQTVKLQDSIHPRKTDLSYADLHYEIIKNVKENSPKSSASHKNLRIGRKTAVEDELVKCMSNLPSYLERGVNPQDNALNVGVLDWGRLEKWQYSHKQIPNRNRHNSVSSSYTSSSFSTDGSSGHSSGEHSCLSSRQRGRHPSLQFHLMASPVDFHSQAIKSVGKSQDVKVSQSGTLPVAEHRKFVDQSSKNHPEIEHCKRKGSEPNNNPGSGTLPNGVKYGVASSTKMKTKVGEFTRGIDNLLVQDSSIVGRDALGKSESVVLLLPKDLPRKNHSRLSQVSDSLARLGRRSAAASQRNFLDINNEAFHAHDTEIPHSCVMFCEADCCKHSDMKRIGSTGAEGKSLSSERSHSVQTSAEVGISQSRSRNLEDKKLTGTIAKPALNEPSKGSDPQASKVAADKVRSASPFRRFGIGMGKISKSSSLKEGFATLQSNSKYISAKSGLDNGVTSSCCETSSHGTTNATSRARSSPLRRLLDPLLKPKIANCHHSEEPLQRDSVSTDSPCKSSDGRLCSSTGTVNSGKVKLDMSSCRTINVNNSLMDKKQRLSTVQALLQIAVKNGHPLFTFAVDNGIDVLAATVKKISTSGKHDHCYIYTFFSIHEVKKKNGRWMNQGGKGKGPEIIPNVVAQMKASGSHIFSLAGQNCINQSGIREFVLFSVDLKQADQPTSNAQQNDELAAIVVKIPNKVIQNSIRDGYQIDKDRNFLEVKDCFPVVTRSAGENGQCQPFDVSRDLVNATVILPSGAHSLPGKGGPSSLIERWKSGGSCDCGGWDLGCKLKILANQNQSSTKSNPSEARSIADRFELFSEGGGEENQPAFLMAPFKDGIYSVEFNSPVSLLQAFSICVAVLDSRKLCGPPD
ncbi:DUF3527 domain-containing protein [Cephalotus follicularis]|uniref:DUF3527 domain-containing protein n=1 Tax=Cephalotus follicularis TaxID=3775 RepID=A0A1Q3C2Z3_CEPFO|nr:DUF3527 domain-containing protein [Cephalotus follicularis]